MQCKETLLNMLVENWKYNCAELGSILSKAAEIMRF